MTFECATPAQRGIESLTDFADHTSKVYQSSVPQQFALSEASWCCMKLPGQSNKTLGKLWGVARASKAICLRYMPNCPTATEAGRGFALGNSALSLLNDKKLNARKYVFFNRSETYSACPLQSDSVTTRH